MTRSQKIVVTIIKPLYHIFLSWEVIGRKNVPPSGPLIVVANHVHVIDGELLLFGVSRWIIYIAKEPLFHYPILGALLRWAQALVVYRQGTLNETRELLKQAEQTLNKGSVIGIFPEGKRSHQGKLQAGKPGLALLASRMHIPILPVGISGTDKIHGISWLWKRPHIVINIGKPFYLPQPDGRVTKLQRKALADLMMQKIAALLPPEYQGVYAKRED
jgi:1-acyl-sn-glycerol-3-phosphate acyltransferase